MPLQREFRGLPDHVGLYQAGRVPMELSQVLNLVASAEDFINPPDFFTFTGTAAAQGVVVASTVVPNNELRRVRWIGANIQNPAGGNGTFVPVVFYVANYYGVSNFEIYGGAANTTYCSGYHFPGDGLVLSPGMAVGLQCQTYAGAGNITVNGLYQAQRINI